MVDYFSVVIIKANAVPAHVMIPPFSCWFYHPGSLEEIKGRLLEHGVNGIPQ
jgi:hypothetical protein